MKLYSYIVARDYGFAPNPFHGYCTLATCKPRIRAAATVGDWIAGTGAKTRYGMTGHLIYAMKVSEILDFNSYWSDPRFARKRPTLNGSLKQMYGDNIYRRHGKKWHQENSHHSLNRGRPNPQNIERDTKADRVLVAQRFVYFGAEGILIPKRFRRFGRTGRDICCTTRGHQVLHQEIVEAFERWLETRGKWGMQGMPLEFTRHERVRSPRRPPNGEPWPRRR